MRRVALGFTLAVIAGGCQRGDRFPKGFQWGSATAAFQVEPGCPTITEDQCLDRGSDWYQWVSDPDLIADSSLHLSGEPLSAGPGMWETFEDDAAKMAADHHTAYRMSIEWSRIFPDGSAESATTVDELAIHANADAVARYHEMFAALAANGITPLVTVDHQTLPLWVHDGKACHADPDTCSPNGWVDAERIVPLIALYAGFLGKEYGGEVDEWATLNEPLATVLAGYLTPGPDRTNPPGLFLDTTRAKAVLHAEILAHGAMYDALHAEDTVDADGDGDPAFVGVVMNMADVVPADPNSADDLRGVQHLDHLYHAMFLDGATSGAWDEDVDGTFETTKPELVGRLDWVGVNYYAVATVRGLQAPLTTGLPVADFYPTISWIPTPEGLGHVLDRASQYGLPVIITENGLSDDDQDYRAGLLEDTLREVYAKIGDGDDVRGYYYWSWVDNYEWNHGMSAYHFGLYGLDPTTKARIERPIAVKYRGIAELNGFAAE